MSEPRVIAPRGKIGTRPPADAPTIGKRAEDKEPPASSKRRLPSMIIGIAVMAAAVVAYWFLMGPGATPADADTAGTEQEVELGAVHTLDSVSLNLAGGRYLRLGLALQLDANGAGEIDGAVALDAAISIFSGHSIDELADLEVREQLKQELLAALAGPYDGEVVGVYYTDFVTQ